MNEGAARPTISVVVPAHNEEDNIRTVLSETQDVCGRLAEEFEIIIIDDVSSDRTGEIVAEAAARDPRIRLLRNEQRIGCHPSELRGLLAATKDLIAFIPADLQVRPSAIETMVGGAGGVDMVIAVRRNRRDHVLRRAMASSFALVVRVFFGVRFRDVDSATLYRRSLIAVVGHRIDPLNQFIPVEIALRAIREGMKVGYVEIDHYPRTAGTPSSITSQFLLRLPFRFASFVLRCWELRVA